MGINNREEIFYQYSKTDTPVHKWELNLKAYRKIIDSGKGTKEERLSMIVDVVFRNMLKINYVDKVSDFEIMDYMEYHYHKFNGNKEQFLKHTYINLNRFKESNLHQEKFRFEQAINWIKEKREQLVTEIPSKRDHNKKTDNIQLPDIIEPDKLKWLVGKLIENEDLNSGKKWISKTPSPRIDGLIGALEYLDFFNNKKPSHEKTIKLFIDYFQCGITESAVKKAYNTDSSHKFKKEYKLFLK